MRIPTTRAWIVRLALPILAVTLVSAQQAQKPPTFRSTTDAVTTDVRVRDKTGKFVPDLTIKDFEIYEDGVLQTLSYFVLSNGGRIMNEMVPTVAPVSEGLILPPQKPITDQSGRIFIILIDDMHLQPLDSIKARKVLEDIRDTVIHENDLIALVSTGFSSIATTLTYDYKKARFNEAIKKTMGSGMTVTEIINAAQTQEGPAGLRHNAMVAFSTAYDTLEQVEKIKNRRKAFIYVSGGYDFNPFKNARFKAMQEMYGQAGGTRNEDPNNPSRELSNEDLNRFDNPFDKNGQQFAESDLIAALAELTRAARRANVTFYTIDPRGLIAGPDINVNLSTEEWRSFVETSVSSLKVLGDETGGFCICNTNEFKKRLQVIDNEMSDYYILGYTSSNPDPLKVTRKLEIKVKRPGLEVSYPPVYRIKR
ncbi:MAG TPA: VWA domain-containing protein [Vicinamibacterales bacterium]|nr:VWA domain-containing protein [Vicinamibacterales bacterium]